MLVNCVCCNSRFMGYNGSRYCSEKCRPEKKQIILSRGKIYINYIKEANYRGYDFELNFEDFWRIKNEPCDYCGIGGINGIDRVDNSVGYLLYNCVSCCYICNIMKNKSSKGDFINHVNRIYKHISGDTLR